MLCSTSKGNQIKFKKSSDGIDYWVKLDTTYESLAEVLCSRYLSLLQFSEPVNVLNYTPIVINNIKGCISEDFAKGGSIKTAYRLLLKEHTKEYYAQFDSNIVESYKLLIDTLSKYYPSIGYYITTLFLVDILIRNSDRHTNNIALLYKNNIYTPTPIFDNGNALFVDKALKYSGVECLNTFTSAKPFDVSFAEQYKHSNYYFPVSVKIISNTLNLSGLDLSMYNQKALNRCLEVLKCTTLKYFNRELSVLY